MPTSSDPPIVAEGLWKRYRIGTDNPFVRLAQRLGRRPPDAAASRDMWALRDVSFRVEPGEALGVVGRNGAGKSTLLKVLCGVTIPTRGTFRTRGRVAPLIEVGAGFHPELSGRENIYLNGTIMGMERVEVARKFDEIVDFSGLGDFIDTPVKKYSSGMLARLGFSVAVHVDPDVLLVDEVLAVGDLAFVLKSYRKIEAIRKEGIPVLLVSHNLQLIRNFCSKAIWLDAGELKAEGTPNDVCALFTRSMLAAVEAEGLDNSADVYRVHTDPDITIEQVRFLDAKGEPAGTFQTGEHIDVEVRMSATRPTGTLIVFITIWQAETGQMLVCHNNLDDGAVHPGLPAAGEAKVTMSLGRMPFVAGLHQVSVSVSENLVSTASDWHEKMHSFRVAGGNVGYGSFHAFPEWHNDR